MSRLILTFEDVAAGALKGAGLADCVFPFGLRFVWGSLPSPSDLSTFLSSRSAAHAAPDSHWLDNLTGTHLDEARKQGLALIEFCERFDAVELWADPEPNVQLQLTWLLDHLRQHSSVVARLALVQTSTRIASLVPEQWGRQRSVPIHNDHLEIASAA
jgi:hypothetical protein